MIYDIEFESGTQYPGLGVVELAELAERRGFGAVWKGETNAADPMLVLAAIASRTEAIQLGTAIYHVFGRGPVSMGIQAATLSDLSRGRLLVGVGVANQKFAAWHGASFDRPATRLREYLDIVRGVASGQPLDYRGEIYSTGGAFKLGWRPEFPHPPLLVGGLGRRLTFLAGQLADGVIVNMALPSKVREIAENARAGAEAAGRDPRQIQVAVKVRCSLNPNRAVARQRLGQVVAFYALADHYDRMLAEMGFAAEIEAVRDGYRAGGFKQAVTRVADRLLDQLPVVAAASVEEVRERLEPFAAAGATRIILPYVPCTDHPLEETARFLAAWE